MLLSVHVLTIPTRCAAGVPVFNDLCSQAAPFTDVEVFLFGDNQRLVASEKWDTLARAAQGAFISVTGDDDRVEPDYVTSLRDAILADPTVDVVCFNTSYHVDGVFAATVEYGIDYPWRDVWGERVLWRPPMERMAIRRDHVLACPRPRLWTGSDRHQLRALQSRLHRETRIPRILAHHMFSTKDKPCIEMQRACS